MVDQTFHGFVEHPNFFLEGFEVHGGDLNGHIPLTETHPGPIGSAAMFFHDALDLAVKSFFFEEQTGIIYQCHVRLFDFLLAHGLIQQKVQREIRSTL